MLANETLAFKTTPEYIFNIAKDIFMSEDFSLAIETLENCFEPEAFPEGTFLKFLKGDMVAIINDNDISFTDNKDKFTEDDIAYKNEVDEILFSYRNVIRANDSSLVSLTDSFDFNLNHYDQKNELIIKLNEMTGKIVNKSLMPYSMELGQLSSKFMLCDYLCFFENKVYLFETSKKPFVSEISELKKDMKEIAEYNESFWN